MHTLGEALAHAGERFTKRRAIVGPQAQRTWDQTLGRIARAAGALQALGVRQGERFGLICRNDARQFELIHAGYWTGSVPVPINFRLAPPEIAQILEDARCVRLGVESVFHGLLGTPPLDAWRARAFSIDAPGADCPLGDYATLAERASPAPRGETKAQDDAIVLFTGGTTGRSKGVRLTHGNVLANARQLVDAMGYAEDDLYLHVAPMFHSADLIGNAMTLVGGAHAFLPQFSGAALLDAIQSLRATRCMLTPAMVIAMLSEPGLAACDLSSLRQIFYGSSPMAPEWIRRAIEHLPGVALAQGYGLTETAPILTVLPMDAHLGAIRGGDAARLASAGRPVAGVQMRIVGGEGDDAPVGTAGEVVVRGPNVSPGYLERPEETAAAFRDGWFHTGDIGRLDPYGTLTLLDRKKDMIISGGENIYSSEVESVLYQHPGVRECAVIGVADERYGEALLALIVPASGDAPDAGQLIEHCRGRIGGYKIPRRFAFVDQLPRSAMGKILKAELRALYRKSPPGTG